MTDLATPSFRLSRIALLLSLLWMAALSPLTAEEHAAGWWDKAWAMRKPITITPASGAEPTGPVMVLLRLHSGNFQFAGAKEDGSDVRIIGEDGKTELALHFERYDALMNEALLWLLVPELKTGAPTNLFLYYGNAEAPAPTTSAKDSFSPSAALIYHFTDRRAPARDSTANGNASTITPAVTEGALIAGGILQFGTNGIDVPSGDTLKWNAGSEVTLSVWVKPTAPATGGALFTRTDGASSLVRGVDGGIPYVEIKDGSGSARTSPGEAIGEGVWKHLALVATGTKTDLFVGGKAYGSIPKPMPALTTPGLIGGTVELGGGFVGEVDQLEIHNAALSSGTVAFAAISQSGSEEALKMVAVLEDEASGGGGHKPEWMEHIGLFGDIAQKMKFDGWVAVALCAVMIVLSWWVSIVKFNDLNSIQKGSELFLRDWRKASSNLASINLSDEESVRSMGGAASRASMRHLKKSPIYHLYLIGLEEISHRVKGDGKAALSARSLQAIRAALDSGLIHESHNMNNGLILLTISIAGGPYIGLLGTVVGVMITFAEIAKSGEVEVAAIAPGIASALLATTVGLMVAIPALFNYSYLSSRIKVMLSSMNVFIDEFVTKMAEFCPEDLVWHAFRARHSTGSLRPSRAEPSPAFRHIWRRKRRTRTRAGSARRVTPDPREHDASWRRKELRRHQRHANGRPLPRAVVDLHYHDHRRCPRGQGRSP